MTGTQRFVTEVAQRMQPGARSAVMRAAYSPDEVLRSAPQELAAYYSLADRAVQWSAAALRKLGYSASFLTERPIRDVYAAEAAEQVLRDVRLRLDTQEFPPVYDAFLLQARTTLLETEKVVGFAARIRDARADRDLLRLGTSAASRAFFAGWGFFGSAPDEARATAQAMRAAH
jgi:hypothetical protein